MMRTGVRREDVLLLPPGPEDLCWIEVSLRDPVLLGATGIDEETASVLGLMHASDQLVVGIAHHQPSDAATKARMGFAFLLAPTDRQPAFEFVYAIVDPAHRRAGRAIHIVDAMSLYAFDELGLPGVLFRVAADNVASQAVVNRLGYPPWKTMRTEDGREVTISWLGRKRWQRRRAELGIPPPTTGGVRATEALDILPP